MAILIVDLSSIRTPYAHTHTFGLIFGRTALASRRLTRSTWTSFERCSWAPGVCCRTRCELLRVRNQVGGRVRWFQCLQTREQILLSYAIVWWNVNVVELHLPDGWVFRSKWAFSSSSACGVKEVRLLRFFDGSTPMKSVKWFWPVLYRFQWLKCNRHERNMC